MSFNVRRRGFVAIVGPSGAGKTTLLNLLGCMDAPTSGALEFLGRPVQDLTERERTRLRREQLGFVFQHFGLLPTLTVAKNVALPAFFCRAARLAAARRTAGQRRAHASARSSSPRIVRRRDATRDHARALVSGPGLLLADEPTGNLDSTTGEAIIGLFKQLNQEGLTIIVGPIMNYLAGLLTADWDSKMAGLFSSRFFS